ncbi:hypothetical protein AB0G02_23850, partial [Actinosynnema sp. NPDC023658]
AFRRLVAGADVAPLRGLTAQIDALAEAHRFEDAATRRDRMSSLVRSLDRAQRLAGLAALPEVVAARPDGSGGWEFAVVRHGRLASAGVARRGTRPMPVVDALVASAETVIPGVGPLFGAPAEEVGVVLRWIDQPGTRLVYCERPWTSPAAGAGAWRDWVARAEAGRDQYRVAGH